MSAILVQRWAKPTMPLPSLENLAAYVQGALEEESKLPISKQEMNRLQSRTDLMSICTPEDYQQLFRSSEDEKADHIWDSVRRAITLAPPDNDSTGSAFISFWDSNIRYILLVAITGKIIRDSNKNLGTPLQRPDFGLLVGGICTFRGEEKPPLYTGMHPKNELIEKLTWTYDPAPYVLGRR